MVEIKKLRGSNSFTNKIVESAVRSQEDNDNNIYKYGINSSSENKKIFNKKPSHKLN